MTRNIRLVFVFLRGLIFLILITGNLGFIITNFKLQKPNRNYIKIAEKISRGKLIFKTTLSDFQLTRKRSYQPILFEMSIRSF